MLARALGVVGLMNVQFAITGNAGHDGRPGDGADGGFEVYILEVNPRASRTVPFVAKATGTPIAKIAARVMAGEKLSAFELKGPTPPHTAVKGGGVSVRTASPASTRCWGPKMKSTGEVMGLDRDFGRAFAKAQLGAGVDLPGSGGVFVSVRDGDKDAAVPIASKLVELGFSIVATHGTAERLRAAGITVEPVNKVMEGQPHIVRCDDRRAGSDGDQHHRRGAGDPRQLLLAPDRAGQ